MKTISHAKARKLAYLWHGGQSSPLYAFASSGIVQNLDALKSEVTDCIRVAIFNDYPEKEQNEVLQLQRYIENRLLPDDTDSHGYLAQWFYDRNIGF